MDQLQVPREELPKVNDGGRNTFTHVAPDERIDISIHQLLLIISRLSERPRGPSIELASIPFAIFLTSLLAVLAADFKDYANISAATWQAVFLILTAASAITSMIVFFRWLVHIVMNRPVAPEEYVANLLQQMAEQSRKLREANSTPTSDKASSPRLTLQQ